MTVRPATGMLAIDPQRAPDSPCWVIDMAALEENLKILARVQREAGCKILLALKGFDTFSTFPLVRKDLVGATASSPGAFRAADGGTLFLDEVGEMPKEVQVVLLRVSEDGRLIFESLLAGLDQLRSRKAA